MEMQEIKRAVEEVVERTSRVIIGKHEQVRLVMMAILCGGHILFDDLPGVGKTTLVKVLSRVLGCGFSRVQFTPDLLPSDIVGMNVFNQKTSEFEMLPGPVMTNIFLADEINRAIPRTQSALLEAMEELQVTIDGESTALPSPFIVMATQNPVEMESTFHLPIAQMDRFLIRLTLGYPGHDDEMQMLRVVGDELDFGAIEPLLDAEKIRAMQQAAHGVQINDAVLDYIVSLVEATRQSELFRLPVGPRGSRALYRATKVWAAMDGRDFVTPDDVKALAPYIFCHRITLSGEARLEGQGVEAAVADILRTVPAPAAKENILNA